MMEKMCECKKWWDGEGGGGVMNKIANLLETNRLNCEKRSGERGGGGTERYGEYFWSR